MSTQSQPPRRRRSAAEAREAVLTVAERRLAERGLEGLNIVDVAKEAGLSHATLLHHFGNAAGMRRALVQRMSARLLGQVLEAMRQPEDYDPAGVLQEVFQTLSTGGHARLLAWMAVESGLDDAVAEKPDEMQGLHGQLAPALQSYLPESWRHDDIAEHLVFLVAAAAIGYGMSRDVLGRVSGLSEEAVDAFPGWLAEQLEVLMGQDR